MDKDSFDSSIQIFIYIDMRGGQHGTFDRVIVDMICGLAMKTSGKLSRIVWEEHLKN